MRIALVHDFLIRLGGAERVLAVLAEMFPKAPIYTLLYDEQKAGAVFLKERVIPSSLQRLPQALRKRHRWLLPLMPRTVEEWDFSHYDVVISSSSAFAHGILTGTSTRHLSYIHSPMRFAWDWTHEYLRDQGAGVLKRTAAALLLNKIRIWDDLVSDRPDVLIANSKTVRQRIKKYYRRDANVIYPPVDIARFDVGKSHENFFLIVSNLTPYKRVDLAIQLFNKIQRKLVIIGDGPQKGALQAMSGNTIQFLGWQDDATTAEYMKNCRAFIFPGEEDFGIAPVEAMACGKPVLAYGRGGLTESVVAGVTGEFFDEPNIESMEDGLARLMKQDYSPQACRERAEEFSKEAFCQQLKQLLSSDIMR